MHIHTDGEGCSAERARPGSQELGFFLVTGGFKGEVSSARVGFQRQGHEGCLLWSYQSPNRTGQPDLPLNPPGHGGKLEGRLSFLFGTFQPDERNYLK